jgi:3-hydroxy-9,10-secoandrosta-1,3,5(10)-triene-9,17-dione monooxygenase reductase component
LNPVVKNSDNWFWENRPNLPVVLIISEHSMNLEVNHCKLGFVLPNIKEAMRHLAGGVSVITAGSGDDRTGLTVTTAHSLSVEPPIMIISVNRKSSGYSAIRDNGHFCVNVLADHQRHVAERFSGVGGIKGKERYNGSNWSVLSTGALALDGAIANVDCEVEEVIDRYSHGIFLGLVRQVRLGSTRDSQLVYHRNDYGAHPSNALAT